MKRILCLFWVLLILGSSSLTVFADVKEERIDEFIELNYYNTTTGNTNVIIVQNENKAKLDAELLVALFLENIKVETSLDIIEVSEKKDTVFINLYLKNLSENEYLMFRNGLSKTLLSIWNMLMKL